MEHAPLSHPIVDSDGKVTNIWRKYLVETSGISDGEVTSSPMINSDGKITDLWRKNITTLSGHMPIHSSMVDKDRLITTIWRKFFTER